ncbi:MAG TPA: LysR family transcriptional regulator [Dongiaceae bacterium]|jgi:DNA-binding transcriptional LysR family regulator
MTEREPGWDLYRTFLAVYRDGSLSVAARKLGLTQPTAGRQIAALESRLGSSLFTRSPRGLMPTEAARALAPHAEAMAVAAAALRRASSGEADATRGAVRVTAGQMVGRDVLPRILADFALRYPQVELELALSDHNLDLLRREADIAVRMMRPTQKALVARRIGEFSIGLFAHRRYVEAFGLPNSSDDFARHRLIGFDRDAHAVHSAGGSARHLRREQFGFRSDDATVQLAALRAGAGVGACYVSMARRDPDLVPVLERAFTFKREMWLAMHEDAKTTRRVRLLFDHLAEGLKAYLKDDG